MTIHNQHKPRGGFPCKRNRMRVKSLKRNVAYSNLLDHYKRINETLYILHATRGWKKFA